MVNRSSSDFLMIQGQTLQEIFETEETDARANPIKYFVTFETTHDDAERSQSGDMPSELPTILNRKSKVEVTWNKLPVTWLSKLCSRLNLVYKTNESFSTIQNVSVSYRDMTGEFREMTAYVSPTITGTYVVDIEGKDYWDSVRIAFIEK